MPLDPITDYYQILDGWCIKDYLTEGVKKVRIYLKNNRSFDDPLTIETGVGNYSIVEGEYLFTSLNDAKTKISEDQAAELSAIDFTILELQNDRRKVVEKFQSVTYEV